MAEVKHAVKDSVFTDLFGDKKYIVQLYEALHFGEDIHITEDDITNVTLNRILTDAMFNDLGFVVGDKIIVLAEAQSTWSVNIIIRALMYLMQSYQEYITDRSLNVYGSKRVTLPKPELYVIYTGEDEPGKEYITLSEEFFGGVQTAVDVKVKVINSGRKGDIIYQYMTFVKVYNEQYKKYGRDIKSINETIRICRDSDVLKEYLSEREKEVISIMLSVFDEETVRKLYEASLYKEGMEKGRNDLFETFKALGVDEDLLKKAQAVYASGNTGNTAEI